ncbi:DUF4760 domain-containing protein [bacterium]|nr:DUF4760 domain-containing protein [bacterium]
MTIQLAILIISGMTLVVIAISTSLLYYQIKSFHEWNRRKETNDFLANIGYGKLAEVRERLRIYVNPYTPDQNYATVIQSLPEKEALKLRSDVLTLLNSFEQVALGIKSNILDEQISYDCLGTMITCFVRWAEPLVNELQSQESRLLLDTSNLAKAWQEKLNLERDAIKAKLIREGKDPL